MLHWIQFLSHAASLAPSQIQSRWEMNLCKDKHNTPWPQSLYSASSSLHTDPVHIIPTCAGEAFSFLSLVTDFFLQPQDWGQDYCICDMRRMFYLVL